MRSSDPRSITRRELLARSLAIAGGTVLASCSHGPMKRLLRADDVTQIETRWPIKRVVYLMLENRSFDCMFGRFPGANGATTGVMNGKEIPLGPCPEWLAGDLPHDHAAAVLGLNGGKLDGFAQGKYGQYFAYTQFDEPDVRNYWTWARNYVLCDNFYASVLGPSYPNHMFMIAGQSGGVFDNPENLKTIEVNGQKVRTWGCDANPEAFVFTRDERGFVTKHRTCFEFETVGDQLEERKIDWSHYAAEPAQIGYIWSAYTGVGHVFHSDMFERHVKPVDGLLRDIRAGALPAVTWITPRFELSDHPPFSTMYAQNWVTDVVDGIMRSDMWPHTAIFLTWDEWGGFYDHVVPPQPDNIGFGMRVPMLVISPYAKRGYVDDAQGEFSSPLKFIADNWDLPYLSPRVAGTHNFEHVFDFARKPRPPDPLGHVPGADGDPFDFPPPKGPGRDHWPEGVEPDPQYTDL